MAGPEWPITSPSTAAAAPPRVGAARAPGQARSIHTGSGPDAHAAIGAEGRERRARVLLPAFGIYAALSVVLWWHTLPHFGTVTTCGCGDAALTLWVVKWPAYALSHGLDPFYSSRLFAPRGINMVPNSLALGVATAPVTWLAGPVASLNLVDLASPPLSALAMLWLLRRWTTWAPAAFVGGLLFGFSPFVLVSLALGHPNFGLLALVPLIVGALDELVARRRRRATSVGAALGLLVVAQFFVSVEVTALLVLFGLLAALGFAAQSVVRRRVDHLRSVARGAAPGLAVAALVDGGVLAYPLWYFFEGRAHLAGRAWPNSPAGTVVNRPSDFVDGRITTGLTRVMHLFGGYQGPRLPLLGFLGTGLVVVLVAGGLWRWRDPLVRCFGLLGTVAVLLSFGITSVWTPWRLFVHAPVLVNVVPVNITVIVDTCAAIVVAVVVDHVHLAVRQTSRPSFAAPVAAATVTALAVVPIATAFWPNIPFTTRAVRTPRWFLTAAPRLVPGAVVLPYPAPFGGIQSSMAWQAAEGMTFSMVGGGGPGVVPSRAGPERPGYELLNDASFPLGPAPRPTAANLRAIRQAIHGWGVTTVVVPDEPLLPSYDRGRSVGYAVGLITAALGTAPRRQSRAWVWEAGDLAAPPVPLTPARFAACTEAGGRLPEPAPPQRVASPPPGDAVAECVLSSR